MKSVDTIARVRRAFHVEGWSLKRISRELHVSRNTVRRILRSNETSFSYERERQPKARRRGWVFLGTHDAAAGSWTKSYFNVGGKPPEDIKPGQTVLVALGRSNVRGGMPNQLGLFYDVTDVVREGTAVSVDAVARWQNSSYVWAKVHYEAAPR